MCVCFQIANDFVCAPALSREPRRQDLGEKRRSRASQTGMAVNTAALQVSSQSHAVCSAGLPATRRPGTGGSARRSRRERSPARRRRLSARLAWPRLRLCRVSRFRFTTTLKLYTTRTYGTVRESRGAGYGHELLFVRTSVLALILVRGYSTGLLRYSRLHARLTVQ